MFEDIELKGKKYFAKTKVHLIRDKDDNKLLELALASKADFLITGNTNGKQYQSFENHAIIFAYGLSF